MPYIVNIPKTTIKDISLNEEERVFYMNNFGKYKPLSYTLNIYFPDEMHYEFQNVPIHISLTNISSIVKRRHTVSVKISKTLYNKLNNIQCFTTKVMLTYLIFKIKFTYGNT